MTNIVQLLGDEAEHLLNYRCTGIAKEAIRLPGPGYVDRVLANCCLGRVGLISGRKKAERDGVVAQCDSGRVSGQGCNGGAISPGRVLLMPSRETACENPGIDFNALHPGLLISPQFRRA